MEREELSRLGSMVYIGAALHMEAMLLGYRETMDEMREDPLYQTEQFALLFEEEAQVVQAYELAIKLLREKSRQIGGQGPGAGSSFSAEGSTPSPASE